MDILAVFLAIAVVSVHGQYAATTSYQQCAANLACSINYEKTFQEKLNNLGYHTTLQLQTMRQSLDSKIDPLTHELELLRANASSIQDGVTRELRHIFSTLDHDKAFLHNLSVGVFELSKEIHHEQYVRFQDVHKLVEEMNLIKLALGLSTNSTEQHNTTACEAQLNVTMQNATFYESQYQKVLDQYHNLQTTVVDIRRQQKDLLAQLREKTIEISRLQRLPTTTVPVTSVSTVRSTKCGDALGMQDGTILDTAVTASESFGSFNAANARLNDGGGWYTSARTTSKDWIQIDLGSNHVITGIATQGAPCCEVWVSNFTLLYSSDSQHWREYYSGCRTRYMDGNKDQTSIKFHQLDPPIVAKTIRLNVIDFHKKPGSATNYIGMRTELYGCPLSTPNINQPQ